MISNVDRTRWLGVIDAVAELFGADALRVRGKPLRGRRLQPSLPLPVEGCLGRALDSGDARICSRMREVRRQLRWRRNSSYADAQWLDGYGYCELLGPNGHWRHTSLAMGLLLLAPWVCYPPHVHPATEVYVVISGTAFWRKANEPWRRRAPGSRILHHADEPHAMRTGRQPLLAAYLWLDHLQQPARLLG